MHHPNITSATVSQPIDNPYLEDQLRDAAQRGDEDEVRSLLDPEKRVNVNAADRWVSTSARVSRRPPACGVRLSWSRWVSYPLTCDIRWIVDALVDGVRATISPPQPTSLTPSPPHVRYHLMDCHLSVWEHAPALCGIERRTGSRAVAVEGWC